MPSSISAEREFPIDYNVWTRGSEDDFNRLATKSGDSGWGWDKLLPYFKKVWTAQYFSSRVWNLDILVRLLVGDLGEAHGRS